MGVSVRAFARSVGVSHTAIQKAIKAGRITAQPDGTLDPEAAGNEWAAYRALAPPPHPLQRPDRPPAPAPRVTPTLPPPLDVDGQDGDEAAQGEAPEDGARAAAARGYQTSRAVREAYMARLAKLEFEERQGKLVNADEVKVAAFNTARRARDLLMAMPDRVSSVLAATDDPHEVRRVLAAEVRRVCEELSRVGRSSGVDLG